MHQEEIKEQENKYKNKMKTIREVIKTLDRKEIEKLAEMQLQRRLEEVGETLGHIRYASIQELNTRRKIYAALFRKEKQELEALDLWDPGYDRIYKLALEGKYEIE